MAETDKMELYKEEVTDRGAMKIEVVLEEAKKKKKERPGSATSIRSMEDIERRQQVKFLVFKNNISKTFSRLLKKEENFEKLLSWPSWQRRRREQRM